DGIRDATVTGVQTCALPILFSAARPPALPATPAKGHSVPTLALVRDALRSAHGDLSAVEVAELTGVSRATAQRYLSYLVREGLEIGRASCRKEGGWWWGGGG